jgi:hypothetical protein
MSVDESLWYVKLADGDVERVTLDQLDEAFQTGQIDENSMVLAAGADQWVKLADLLGVTETTEPPAAALQAAPQPMVAPQPQRTVPIRQAAVAPSRSVGVRRPRWWLRR